MHICRFRDLMTGPQLKGLLNGTNTELSLSFLTYIMGENPEGDHPGLSPQKGTSPIFGVCMYICYAVCTFLYPATTHAEEVVKGRKSDLEELANDPSMRIPPYCLPSADLPPLLPFYPEGILEKVVHWCMGRAVWCAPPPYVFRPLL